MKIDKKLSGLTGVENILMMGLLMMALRTYWLCNKCLPESPPLKWCGIVLHPRRTLAWCFICLPKFFLFKLLQTVKIDLQLCYPVIGWEHATKDATLVTLSIYKFVNMQYKGAGVKKTVQFHYFRVTAECCGKKRILFFSAWNQVRS